MYRFTSAAEHIRKLPGTGRRLALAVLLSFVPTVSPLSGSSAIAAGPCNKPTTHIWTHAFYYDQNATLLQIEALQPNHDMTTRFLRKLGDKPVPCMNPVDNDKYYCPTGFEIPKNPEAVIAVYYAAKTSTTNVEAYCWEKLGGFDARPIKCARDPWDGSEGACTFCYCITRPCPPKCCQ